MVEPIQGEAGVVVPSDGYLKGVRWTLYVKGINSIFIYYWINTEPKRHAGYGSEGTENKQ